MSVKEFNEGTKNYKPEGYPISPYLLAKQEWDNRIGSARVQASNWRLCCFGLIVICIILLFINSSLSSKSRITPYVIQLAPDGSAMAVGPATEMNFIPSSREIVYFLSQFVQKTRVLSLDPIIDKQNWLAAYTYLSPSGAAKMNTLVQKENPFLKLGTETVMVDITVVIPLSKDTYQVRWRESRYSNRGTLIEESRMTGSFTISFIEPKTEKQVMANPLGLYIKDFSWAKDIDN